MARVVPGAAGFVATHALSARCLRNWRHALATHLTATVGRSGGPAVPRSRGPAIRTRSTVAGIPVW